MSESGIDPIHPAEEAFHVDMASRSAGEPHHAELPPIATPGAAPVIPPASPAATPPAAGTTPAFPVPQPTSGFEVPPAPAAAIDPTLETLQRIESKLAPPAVAAQPAKSAIDMVAEKILNDPDASDEAKLLAQATLDQNTRLSRIEAAQVDAATRAHSELIAQAEAQIRAEQNAVRTQYNFTDAEIQQIEIAWANASDKDPRFGVLTFGEAARRLYGDAAIDARRIGARLAPLGVPTGGPPAAPDVRPAGHLVSDASAGATGTRGGWTPPVRDKGPTLNDALAAAHEALDRH